MAGKDENIVLEDLEFIKLRYNKTTKEINDLLTVLKLKPSNLPSEVRRKVKNCANALVLNGATTANEIEVVRANASHVLEQTKEIDFLINLKQNIRNLENILNNLMSNSNQLNKRIDYYKKYGDVVLQIDGNQDLLKENNSPAIDNFDRDDDDVHPHRNVLELKRQIEAKSAILKKLTMGHKNFPQDLNLARAKLQKAKNSLNFLNDELKKF